MVWSQKGFSNPDVVLNSSLIRFDRVDQVTKLGSSVNEVDMAYDLFFEFREVGKFARQCMLVARLFD